MEDKNKISINFDNTKTLFRRLIYYFKIWFLMSRNAFMMVLNQKSVLMIFLLGKVLRFLFFIAFILFLIKGTGDLAGYNSTQVIFFFLSYMIIDTTTQFLFREVYKFRPLIVSGDFDLILTKPMSALFRVLMGGADVIDFITLPPLYLATFYVGRMLSPSLSETILYILLLITGFIIAAALHIIVVSMGIITFEIDHTIMIYRDVTAMGRFPVDIYRQPLKGFLTFFIPVALMMSLPAKALMGLISVSTIMTSVIISFLFVYIALRFWNFALKKYTSASS